MLKVDWYLCLLPSPVSTCCGDPVESRGALVYCVQFCGAHWCFLSVTLKTQIVFQCFTERQNSIEKNNVKSKILGWTLPTEHQSIPINSFQGTMSTCQFGLRETNVEANFSLFDAGLFALMKSLIYILSTSFPFFSGVKQCLWACCDTTKTKSWLS